MLPCYLHLINSEQGEFPTLNWAEKLSTNQFPSFLLQKSCYMNISEGYNILSKELFKFSERILY